MQTWSRQPAEVQTKHYNEEKKCDLSDVDRGMVLGPRWAAMSKFFHKLLICWGSTSEIYRQRSEDEKISSEQLFSG